MKAPTPGRVVTKSAPNAFDGVVAPAGTSPRSTRTRALERGDDRELVALGHIEVTLDGRAGRVLDAPPDRRAPRLAVFFALGPEARFSHALLQKAHGGRHPQERRPEAQHRRHPGDPARHARIDRDVGDARRMKRRHEVSPRDRHPEPGAAGEGELARARPGKRHDAARLAARAPRRAGPRPRSSPCLGWVAYRPRTRARAAVASGSAA